MRRLSVNQQVGDDDCAGVDERITRDAMFELKLDNRVERISGGLAADTIPDRTSEFLQRQRQREDLGDAIWKMLRPRRQQRAVPR